MGSSWGPERCEPRWRPLSLGPRHAHSDLSSACGCGAEAKGTLWKSESHPPLAESRFLPGEGVRVRTAVGAGRGRGTWVEGGLMSRVWRPRGSPDSVALGEPVRGAETNPWGAGVGTRRAPWL